MCDIAREMDEQHVQDVGEDEECTKSGHIAKGIQDHLGRVANVPGCTRAEGWQSLVNGG